MAGNFEIFMGSDKLYRFQLLDERGRVLVTSAGYGCKGDAVSAITAVRESAGTGHIHDLSEPVARVSHAHYERRRLSA